MHIHTRETEYIYVLDGELTAYVGDETLTAQPGGFVFMPRNVPRPAFSNALIITGPHPRDL